MSSIAKSTKLRLCRICLDAKCKERVKFHANSEWSQLFEYCFGLQITADDAAPLEFCGSCAKKLQEYSTFKRHCIKSDLLWKSKLCSLTFKAEPASSSNNSTTVIKDEPINEEYIESDHSYNDDQTYQETTKKNRRRSKRIKKAKVKYEIPWANIDKPLEQKFPEKYYEEIYVKEEDEESSSSSEQEIDASIIPEQDHIQILPCIEPPPKTMSRFEEPKLPKELWICDKCGVKCRNGYWLTKHMKRCDGKEKPKIKHLKTASKQKKSAEPKKELSSTSYCGLCDFTSRDYKIVAKHFNEHDTECKLCPYIGRDLADMARHRYEHHPQEEKHKYICPICLLQIHAPLKVEFHYRSVHLKKKGGLCSDCGKVFGVYKNYRNHKRIHTDIDKFICDICGLEYLYRNEIISHLNDHGDNKNFICDTCGRGFNRARSLKGHVKNMHTPKQSVLCTHCNRTYSSQERLERHMRYVNMDKPYVCNVCFKAYPILTLLKSHMIWHSDERPWSCDNCGKNYKVKSQLKTHMRMHTGHYPFKCTLCDKSFAAYRFLKQHQSAHTGIRPVKCPHCDRTFYAKSLMRAHCSAKHNVHLEK